MANDPKNPLPGELAIDATALSSFVVDLQPGAMRGMRPAQDGLIETLAEITTNQPSDGGRAGVSDAMINELTVIGERIGQVDTFLNATGKMFEVLTETRAKLENDRFQIISAVASSVDRRARIDENVDLLAKYEKTRAYRSALGVKAAKTRAKNEEAAQATNGTP